jgi:hypothetical protein
VLATPWSWTFRNSGNNGRISNLSSVNRQVTEGSTQNDHIRSCEPIELLTRTFLGPVPNDIQHLAYEAFEIGTTRVDRDAALVGLEQAVAHEAATYGEEFSRRSPGQRRVLIELAARSTDAPTSAAFVEAVGLANASSARKAVRSLEADEVVVERNGRWKVADPFFAAWLAGTTD